jgi:hypothetical protein
MKFPSPTTPQEVRHLMRSDVTLATDAHLLAMILARGSNVRRAGVPQKNRGCVELGEMVLEVNGGDWPTLADKVADDAVDFPSFGITLPMGARLIASVELSLRWRRHFQGVADCSIREGAPQALMRSVYERRGQPTAGELVAVILGMTEPMRDEANGLLAALDGPRRLVETLSFADFESVRNGNRLHLRLVGSKVELELSTACRLLAAIELARRYRLVRGPELPALTAGMFGLQSPLLVELLDPASDAPEKLRVATLDALRFHPEMTSDFATLDRLARDAGTENLLRAVELGLMFELLRQDKETRRPAEILGESAPFDALLAIAEARISRAPTPSRRMSEIKERLERTSRQLPEKAIERFAAALAELELPPAIADEAFEEARRRYLEITGPRPQAAVA